VFRQKRGHCIIDQPDYVESRTDTSGPGSEQRCHIASNPSSPKGFVLQTSGVDIHSGSHTDNESVRQSFSLKEDRIRCRHTPSERRKVRRRLSRFGPILSDDSRTKARNRLGNL